MIDEECNRTNYGSSTLPAETNPPASAAAADMNRPTTQQGAGAGSSSRGALDLVLGDSASEEVVILEGDGRGGFTRRTSSSDSLVEQGGGAGAVGTVADLALADVNGDGNLDVVTALAGPLPNTDELSTLFGDGAFGLDAGPRSRLAGLPVRLELLELTADGRIDAVVGTGAGLEVMRGRGDGSFERNALLGAGRAVSDIAIGSSANGSTLVAAMPEENEVKVYRRQDENFEEVATIAVEEPRAVSVGDFTGNGIEDVVVSSAGGFVALYPGREQGGFGAALEERVTGVVFKRLTRTDLNGDGRADLVGLERTTAALHFLLGRGDGTFDLQAGPATTGQGAGVVVGDFNGDRLPDVLVSGDEIVIGLAELSGPPILAGDATGEGEVNEADVEQLISEIFDGDGSDALSCGGGAVASAAGADANGDQAIGAADVSGTGAATRP